MIPTFALPGESAPGQFGPIMRHAARADVRVEPEHLVRRAAPSVMQIDGPDPRVDRLVDRVGRERARGRRPCVVFAPVSATASATVSKTGIPSTSWPPFPGVTPATTCVP